MTISSTRVRGLMRAYLAGNVALANAVRAGVADYKGVYAYMPRMIPYYLDEDPILPNVETHICREPKSLAYTLDHLEQPVLKPVDAAGTGRAAVALRAHSKHTIAQKIGSQGWFDSGAGRKSWHGMSIAAAPGYEQVPYFGRMT
jgi:uncharacterized circularly permuted ATP-grasp superfamily protein